MEAAVERSCAVHAAWIPGDGLFVWAEGPEGGFAPAARLGELFPPLARAERVERTLQLPNVGGRPLAAHPMFRQPPAGPPALSPFNVPGLRLGVAAAAPWLAALDEPPAPVCDDVKFWRAAARLALKFVLEELYLPVLERDGAVRARWRPIFDVPDVADQIKELKKARPDSAGSEQALRDFLGAAVDELVRKAARDKRVSPAFGVAAEDAWLSALVDAAPEAYAAAEDQARIEGSLAAWRARLGVASSGGIRVGLRLKPPKEAKGRWTLEYLLQSLDDPSLVVEAAGVWSSSRGARRLERVSGSDPEARLLTALAIAARLFYPIERSLLDPEPVAASLDAKEAYAFLKDAAPALASSGFGLLLPPWWRSSKMPRLSLRLGVRPQPDGGRRALGLQSVVKLDVGLALGEAKLSKKELEELAALKAPLVRLRGQWVEADPEAIQKALETWGEAGRELTLGELFEGLREGDGGLEVSELEAEGWAKELLAPGAAKFEPLPPPAGLAGELRPYQLRGFSWLAFTSALGFGACLADDMGLGKTVQTLAFLLREKAEGRLKFPALLLCPTSVVTNWKKEAERFTPGLSVAVHHGTERRRSRDGFEAEVRGRDLVITTYALARVDEPLLALPWSGLIFDEAQNVKNPEALQSRAARRLKGRFRIALTGTPVENRLSELWSIMQVLNPGFLGSYDEFRSRFVLPIERFKDERAARSLRQLTRPFLLRRFKTDPGIAPELPNKLEMKVYCPITKEQATLYRAVVRDMLERIGEATGMARRGQVLAAITKLKQVLNHPAQFLKDGSALPGRSGKLERLTEMLQEALAEGDSALVFTQFAEMGELLRRHLSSVLGEETLYFHGGLPKQARDALVDRFQKGGARLMVLTLKAGGFGLNLTRANHVFHFDRWWNPAVETQAADRVYRIGQNKKVQVRKLLCAGTLEEAIDKSIEEKRALAEKILGSGEAWLTELSNDQLRELFTLREEALEVS